MHMDACCRSGCSQASKPPSPFTATSPLLTSSSPLLLFHSWVRPSARRFSTTATRYPRRCSAAATISPRVPPAITMSYSTPAAAAAAAAPPSCWGVAVASLLLVLVVVVLGVVGSGGRGVVCVVTTVGPGLWGWCFWCLSACGIEWVHTADRGGREK